MNSDEIKSRLGIKDNEAYRVDPDSGKVQKEGFFGWKHTDKRIEPESGIIQKEGFFGWKDTNTRIDHDSGVVQKDGFFGPKDTDTRIDPDTGVIQQEGFWGWKDTEERIDPKTGKHQKLGFFGWKDSSCLPVPDSSQPEPAVSDQPKPVFEGVDRNYNTSEPSRSSSHDSWSTKDCIRSWSMTGLVIGVIYNFFSCLNTKHPPPPQSDMIFLPLTYFFNGAFYGYLIGAALGLIIGLMKKK